MHAHMGNLKSAHEIFCKCDNLIQNHPDIFSIKEKCENATMAGTIAFDAADAGLAMPILEKISDRADDLSMHERAALWGTCSQLLRLEGRYSQAVEAGKRR